MAVSFGAKNKKDLPNFKPGDTVRVSLKVVEGSSERIQVFEGVVIRRRGAGVSETFTVRKISFGVGVERILPLLSPRIAKIEVVKTGKARRAKLYYLRKLKGKAARLKETKSVEVPETGEPAPEAEVEAETPAQPASDKTPAQDGSKVEAAA